MQNQVKNKMAASKSLQEEQQLSFCLGVEKNMEKKWKWKI